MEKPIQKTQKPAYDWNECVSYIEEKYNIDIRNYAKKTFGQGKESDNAPYQDFWHWICEMNDDIRSGCYIEMSLWNWLDDPDTETWIKEIIKMFVDEFGEEPRFWVVW